MDFQYTGIITLLRCALNNEKLSLPQGFQWQKATETLYAHYLTSLGIQGAILCGVPRNHPVITQMTRTFCQLVQNSRNQTKKLNEVCALFEANGIAYLPIKGAVIKSLYPRPEYRMMGDADILIRPEQYPQIRKLLSEAGLQEIDNCNYEYTWKCPELTLELHRHLVSEHFSNYFEYYEDSWRFAKKNEEGTGFHLSPEDHMVYFVVHFSKHYCSGSICAKDICDFYVWRKAYPDMDEAYIVQELKKLRLETFYHNILDLLEHWFVGKPVTDAVELITRSAFQGGVHQDINQSAADNILQRYASKSDSLFTKKLKWFCHALFPSRNVLSYRYPILKRYAFLLPIFWVSRWFHAIFKEHDRLRRGIIVANTDASDISEYDQHLVAVGLDKIEQR